MLTPLKDKKQEDSCEFKKNGQSCGQSAQKMQFWLVMKNCCKKSPDCTCGVYVVIPLCEDHMRATYNDYMEFEIKRIGTSL